MLRVVLDTNVLISALLKPISLPNQIFQAFRNKKFLLITSPQIVAEVEDVLNRPGIVVLSKMTPKDRELFIEKLLELSLVTSGKLGVEVIKDDPDDDKFISCALEGKAEYIVSGDKHLLDIGEYEGVKIISPREFIENILGLPTF